MGERTSKTDDILDAAEIMARTGGYNGFSFREIAKKVGIKAASVHYHFPGKADLGAAVARRYTDRFLAGLGDPEDTAVSPEDLMRRYIAAYRTAIVDEGLMCLCGVYGAEIAFLPELVAAEAKRFFETNIDWLMRLFARVNTTRPTEQSRASALRIVASLEGAMILARTLGDATAFDAVAESISLNA